MEVRRIACSRKQTMEVKMIFLAILLQFGYAGLNIFVKYALDAGLNTYTFVIYRHAIAVAVIAPFAIIFERFPLPVSLPLPLPPPLLYI